MDGKISVKKISQGVYVQVAGKCYESPRAVRSGIREHKMVALGDGMRGSIEQHTDQDMKAKTIAFVMCLMMILIGWLMAATCRFAAGT